MREVNNDPKQKRLWRAVAAGTALSWGELFAGYQSCVDWPSAHCWRQLIDVYPNAKVVLTYRSPESWWESFSKTILVGITRSTDLGSIGVALIRETVFSGRAGDRDYAVGCGLRHASAQASTAPASTVTRQRNDLGARAAFCVADQ